MRSASCILSAFLLCVASACRTALPLPAPVPIQVAPRYLLGATAGVTGEQKHLVRGVWCADDDAFAIPVTPFAKGPTEIVDSYEGWGSTTYVAMLNREQSAVMVARTRIGSDFDQETVYQELVQGAFSPGASDDELSVSLVSQNGLEQIQQVNRFPLYEGRDFLATLLVFNGFAKGSRYPSCRVDRHFVGAGYYFHVIAIAHEPANDVVPCDFAMELASWTVENLHIGEAAGHACEPGFER